MSSAVLTSAQCAFWLGRRTSREFRGGGELDCLRDIQKIGFRLLKHHNMRRAARARRPPRGSRGNGWTAGVDLNAKRLQPEDKPICRRYGANNA
eukprot:scaffold154776_cov36-Tisochrysis_lutea.AAC.1